ncbi:MAG: hypothetical protein AB7D51_02000 [Desulfovibrionaceae bacterium]|jgi:hypothetical protein
MNHRVSAKMKDISLARAGSAVDMQIYGDDHLLGHIIIGKGTFRWRKAKQQKNKTMNWTRFFQFLEANADQFLDE